MYGHLPDGENHYQIIVARAHLGEAKIAAALGKGSVEDDPRIVKARAEVEVLEQAARAHRIAVSRERDSIILAKIDAQTPTVQEGTSAALAPAVQRAAKKKKSRSPFGYVYGGVPLVILADPFLSANAKVASGLIAEKLFNFPASKYRRREISYSQLAAPMGVSMPTAIAAVRELTADRDRRGKSRPPYLRIKVKGIGQRGNLYEFTEAIRALNS